MWTPARWISGLVDLPSIGGLSSGEQSGDALKTAVTHPEVRADWDLVCPAGTAKAPAESREIADVRELGRIGQTFREERQDLPGSFLGEMQEARMNILLASIEDCRDSVHLVDEADDPRTVGQIPIEDGNIAQGNAEVLDERGRVALGQG
jgi:hypothetical protein